MEYHLAHPRSSQSSVTSPVTSRTTSATTAGTTRATRKTGPSNGWPSLNEPGSAMSLNSFGMSLHQKPKIALGTPKVRKGEIPRGSKLNLAQRTNKGLPVKQSLPPADAFFGKLEDSSNDAERLYIKHELAAVKGKMEKTNGGRPAEGVTGRSASTITSMKPRQARSTDVRNSIKMGHDDHAGPSRRGISAQPETIQSTRRVVGRARRPDPDDARTPRNPAKLLVIEEKTMRPGRLTPPDLDLEDEMALGSTPPTHMIQGYREDRQMQWRGALQAYGSGSSSVSGPGSRATAVDRRAGQAPLPAGGYGGSEAPTRERKAKQPVNPLSDSESDPNTTPRAKTLSRRKKSVADSTSEASNGDDDQVIKPKKFRSSAGRAFFEELGVMSSEADDVDYESLLTHKEHSHHLLGHDLEGDDDYTAEEMDYLAGFRSKTDLCPYCSEPFPVKPTHHLLHVKAELESISVPDPTPANPSARSLPWQQSNDFCSLHRAETGLIPLAIRYGYPDRIDFLGLNQRLERGWIRSRLDEIVAQPETSSVFVGIKNEIRTMGHRWGGLKHQSKQETLEAVKAGYYGDLGRDIVINHFLQLREWGYFPTLRPATSTSSKTSNRHAPPSLDPLSWHDFISHVLVPEAANLLIMDDKGHRWQRPDDAAYHEAVRVRRDSVRYGTWKFRDEGREAEGIKEALRLGADTKRKRLRKLAVEPGNSGHRLRSESVSPSKVDLGVSSGHNRSVLRELHSPPAVNGVLNVEGEAKRRLGKNLSDASLDSGCSHDFGWDDEMTRQAFAATDAVQATDMSRKAR
ncbi:hypothetical protein IAU60_001007 [Kwoniella sp. DSM 27419]